MSLSDRGGVITYPPPAYRSVEDLEANLPECDPDSSPLPLYRSQSFSYLSISNDTELTHASQDNNGPTRINWNNARRTSGNHTPRVRKARRFPAFSTPRKITLILMVLVSACFSVVIWGWAGVARQQREADS